MQHLITLQNLSGAGPSPNIVSRVGSGPQFAGASGSGTQVANAVSSPGLQQQSIGTSSPVPDLFNTPGFSNTFGTDGFGKRRLQQSFTGASSTVGEQDYLLTPTFTPVHAHICWQAVHAMSSG